MDSQNTTGPISQFFGSGIGTYNTMREQSETGTIQSQLRSFFIDYQQINIPAGSTYTGTVFTFTNCQAFKIAQVQISALRRTAAGAFAAIDYIDFQLTTGLSGHFYPMASKTFGGTGTNGYPGYIRIAQDPDFHAMNYQGPVIIQQGTTLSLSYEAYAAFALNDELQIGVNVTWQEI